MKETEMHAAFMAWLDKVGVPFIHSRTDRRTTTKRGDPDFLLMYRGRCLGIEIKVLGGKLRPEQRNRMEELKSVGCQVSVCYSLEECVHAAITWMGSDTRPYLGHPSRPLDCAGVPISSSKGKADTQ